MATDKDTIDRALAAAVRGGPGGGDLFDAFDPAALAARIAYHGVAGLLHDHPALGEWSAASRDLIRHTARGLALWELRHRALMAELLAALAAANIVAILLKGTAVAYDLYPNPSARARGDTDLLIAPSDLDQARALLAKLDYRPYGDEPDAYGLQQVWIRTCDGGVAHHVDLHWQVLNTPALRDVLDFADATARPIPLPRLSPDALAMDRVRTLLHTCIHRTMHVRTPYFVDGRTYYGGDRLIWLNDIRLLATALSEPEWTAFGELAVAKGVAAPCLDGLDIAHRLLAAAIPAGVIEQLGRAGDAAGASAYLDAPQAARAWHDVGAIPGLRRKLGYVSARALPPAAFIRGKYPRLARLPLPLLYARRWIDLFRARSRQSG